MSGILAWPVSIRDTLPRLRLDGRGSTVDEDLLMMMRSILLCSWTLVLACLVMPQLVQGAEAERVRAGLRVLYDFGSMEGEVVADRSGVGKPLDLEISDMEAVRRRPGSLEIHKPTLLRTPGRANKIADAVRLSGEITLEFWMTPRAERGGAARRTIAASSPKSNQLNLVFDQADSGLDIRFRTTRTGTQGKPAMEFATTDLGPKLTHLVYTRDRTGRTRIFIDGKQALEATVPGSTEGWERFPFSIANELDGESPWLGVLHLVAVYNRDLLASEVEQNFRVGPDFRAPALLSEDQELSGGDLFEAKIAPLLSSKCLECHNSKVTSGGVDLSTQQTAFAERSSGAAVVAGDLEASRLIALIAEDKMPLGRPPLLKAEKAVLREWVEGGADWTLDKIGPAVHAAPDKVSEAWVQRLTVPEYIATVRAIFGLDVADRAAEILPADNRADGFKNTAYNLNVDLGHVGAYARMAEIIVSRLDLRAFANRYTDSQALSDENLGKLISGMGRQLLRGPLEEEELSLYHGLAGVVQTAGGEFEEVVGYLAESMLQSPRFLYRVENQRGDGLAWPPGEYELASRLSYILWGAPPDEALMAAADAGKLHDPDVFDQHIRRMLADRRAVERSEQFLTEWLDLDRLSSMQPNAKKFPQWQPELAGDMRQETLAFFRDVVWEQKRPMTDLLNAQFTYATPRLARHYGLEPQGDGLARYDLAGTPSRGGLLTQGSVLTIGGDEASMVTRGLFVLKELLFGEVGSPPPGLDTTPPPTSPGRSHRAIAMERVNSAACGGCHSRFEPLAFGLEKFDGLGSFHETDEHGNELREDGQVVIPGVDQPVKYNAASEMMDLLAQSERVEQTLVRKLTQFALGRPLIADDEALVLGIHRQAKKDGLTYASLITALLKSDLVQLTRTEM